MTILDLKITNRLVAELVPYAQNARIHSDRQIAQIARSIRQFGFINPVLVDDEGGIVAGHGRVLAAKKLGLEQVPTIRLEHMTVAEKRAYIIADNRLAENAGWDKELLALEFSYLADLDIDVDATITGFETAEIDLIIEGQNAIEADKDDDIPAPPALEDVVSRLGDLWELGNHRLLCGNALELSHLSRLMADLSKARIVFTDPPYNVAVGGHVSGLGKIKHREFAMASGEMSRQEFTNFLTNALTNFTHHMMDGALAFVCMDWRHMSEVIAAGEAAFSETKNVCVWVKTNAGMGSLYRSQHEFVFVFKHGKISHINNIELGAYGRYRTNIWNYPGVNVFRQGREEDLAAHPTVKPIAMIIDAIKDVSKRGDIILDGFAGSGTTLLAAERTGRVATCLEIDPIYVDVAIQRWQEKTGKTATLFETKESFDEIKARRKRESKEGDNVSRL